MDAWLEGSAHSSRVFRAWNLFAGREKVSSVLDLMKLEVHMSLAWAMRYLPGRLIFSALFMVASSHPVNKVQVHSFKNWALLEPYHSFITPALNRIFLKGQGTHGLSTRAYLLFAPALSALLAFLKLLSVRLPELNLHPWRLNIQMDNARPYIKI